VNWCPHISLLYSSAPPLVNSSSNISLSSNAELVQTIKGSWVDTSLIHELCFVFLYALLLRENIAVKESVMPTLFITTAAMKLKFCSH
jgi:hypothetical protein